MQPKDPKTGKPQVKLDPKKDPANKQVEQVTTKPDAVSTAEAAALIAAEAKATTELAEKEAAAAAAALQEAGTRTPGAAGKQQTIGYRGKPKAVEAASMHGSVRFNDPDPLPDYTFDDQDRIERDSRLATSKVDEISAKVIREATQKTQAGDGSITGKPQDDEVYQEESDSALQTMVGANRYRGFQDPRYRSNGATYIGMNSIAPLSGDYVAGLHDVKKKFNQGKLLLFNKLDVYGMPVPNVFVSPKAGMFWLRGIRMFDVMEQDLTTVATVPGRANDGTANVISIQQFIPVEDSLPMFDVVDVTPYLEIQTAATLEVMELATCIDSKYQFGFAEKVGKAVELANLNKTEPGEIVPYPDYTMGAQRSTLQDGSIGGAKETTACYTPMDKYALFMQYLTDSELFSAFQVLNVHNMKNTMKYFKANEGRRAPTTEFYDHVFNGNPAVGEANINSATVANYASSFASINKFNTMAKWIYTFSEFWTRIECIAANFIEDNGADSDAMKAISLAKVNKESLSKLQDALAIGRFTSAEGANSSDILATSGTMDCILSFDPNDLIQAVDGAPRVNVYPACGYTNFWAKENPQFGQRQHYYILPTWMQALILAADDDNFVDTITNVRNDIRDFFTATKLTPSYYYPVRVDTIVPSYLSIWFLEAMTHFSKRIRQDSITANALLRWHSFLQSKNIEFDETNVTVRDYLTTVLNNKALWLDPVYRTPADYPLLFAEAARKYKFGLPNTLLASALDMTVSSRHWAIFAPDLRDANLFDLKGFSLFTQAGQALTGDTSLYDFNTRMADSGDLDPMNQQNDWALISSHFAIRGNVNFEDDMIQKLTRGYKIPQFGANASDYGYADEPVVSMFHDDDFDIVQPVDFYIPIVSNGALPLGDTIPDANKHIEMAPAMVVASGTFGVAQSDFYGAAKVIDGVVNVSPGFRAWGATYLRGALTFIEEVFAPLDLELKTKERMIRRPSLYGYTRFLPSEMVNTVTVIADDFKHISRYTENELVRYGEVIPHVDQRSFRLFGFFPNIIDVGQCGYHIDLGAITESIYYDRQNCIIDLEHALNLAYFINLTGIKLFKSSLVYNTVVADDAWEDELLRYHYQVNEGLNNSSIRMLFTLIGEEIVDRMNDDRMRYLGTGPSILTDSVSPFIADELARIDIVTIGSLHDHLGQDYRSQFMFNDTANYVIGRPFEFLHRQWELYCNVAKLFTQKYRK